MPPRSGGYRLVSTRPTPPVIPGAQRLGIQPDEVPPARRSRGPWMDPLTADAIEDNAPHSHPHASSRPRRKAPQMPGPTCLHPKSPKNGFRHLRYAPAGMTWLWHLILRSGKAASRRMAMRTMRRITPNKTNPTPHAPAPYSHP